MFGASEKLCPQAPPEALPPGEIKYKFFRKNVEKYLNIFLGGVGGCLGQDQKM